MQYPPVTSDEEIEPLVAEIKDWQLTHGALLKLVRSEEDHTVLSRPVGVSLFPSPFPRYLFEEALSLQKIYNKLYVAIAQDDEWLYDSIKCLLNEEPLVRALWDIYQEAKPSEMSQPLSLGIFRSDYMLHVSPSDIFESVDGLQLKQVEFNSFSCAGGAHGNKTSDMHHYLQRTGAYYSRDIHITAEAMPLNKTIKTITTGLAMAHKEYGHAKTAELRTCVLMIVQPGNFNIADERPIEYGLWGLEPPIPTYRVIFGSDVLKHTSLSSTGELFYHQPSAFGINRTMEVSVIYMRAGYDSAEYDNIGMAARLQLERSRAIKCPALLSHITTFKKVQQALAVPGILERFLPAFEANQIRKLFVPIYPMDNSLLGREGRELAMNTETASDYVLKPSLEGGGHNIYGDDIPAFLASIPEEAFCKYILMERITSPMVKNFLMSSEGLYQGPVVSELGVFGVCLWRRGRAGKGVEMVEELQPQWSFKTKSMGINEMSVVKGYGCFDSPLLMDWISESHCCEAKLKIQ